MTNQEAVFEILTPTCTFTKKGKLENHPQKNAWLVDIALRLITVLALDRFGDFVSDLVVAQNKHHLVNHFKF